MENVMNIEEKIEFINSLKSGDYFYNTIEVNGMKYCYLSIFKGINKLSNITEINEFATFLYKSADVADDEINKLYYNAHSVLFKNDRTFGQIKFLRKANTFEKRYFNKLLKKSYKDFSKRNRLDEIPMEIFTKL